MEYKGKNNLIGKQFGKLTVIEYDGNSSWLCECECGNKTTVTTSNLKNGKTKSCGCLRGKNLKGNVRAKPPKYDLTNQRFGKLTAISYVKGSKWLCKCDCGKETTVETRNLLTGHTRSCGCLVKENGQYHTTDMLGYEDENFKVLSRAGSDNQGIALWNCLCKKCGKSFITRGSHIRTKEISSCGCVHSQNEKIIRDLLEKNNIEYSTQYTFPDLIGLKGGHLRFDFAIFKNGKLSHLIEYNGLQHYIKAEGHWGSDFEELQQRDLLKQQYCKEHNIPLIIIKYDEEYDINTLLI